jgi:glycogen debranching enzyme
MRVSTSRLEPVSMQQAVGYGAIETSTELDLDSVLVLKHDRLFLLLDGHGAVDPPGRGGLGLYFDDTRILSHYALRLTGGPPALLSAQNPADYLAQIDLAISDRSFGDHSWDPRNIVHIRREILLEDRLIERLTLTNYGPVPLDYTVELLLGCDFADIFEVRGWLRAERGQFYAPLVEEDELTFRYRDRAGELLSSTIRFATPPSELHADRARWQLRLTPGGREVLAWELLPQGVRPAAPRSGVPLEEKRAQLGQVYQRWRAECSHWRTSNEEFDQTVGHAIDDLRALYVDADGEEVISAGIPWYSTVFGRDSIITSLQTLPVNPRIALDTLRYLARRQGMREDPFREEQPGRIMHELRRGEMARAGETPHTPYFGTIDATPLWLILLHEAWRWTGDRGLVQELLPHARRALDWIDRYGDLDGDGLVEYARTSAKGLVNQGWKDSGDGVPFPDGTLPAPPIALVEVQGYVYDAKMRMAQLLRAFGEPDAAERLRAEAVALRARIEETFWLEEEGTYAIALDGAKRPLPTSTSNAGHLLWSRAIARERAARVTDELLSADMFSGWGIRTLSERHAVYNPMSYHNGSIWPHDNALIVMGMAHYGQAARTLPVLRGLHEAAMNMRLHRLPELFCGMTRAQGLRPVLYPVSCSPQAWASGAVFMLLQAVLGILPDAPAGVLHIREPVLPDFLDRLEVNGLQVGGTRVGLEFRRYGERTLANLVELEGEPLRVVIELA